MRWKVCRAKSEQVLRAVQDANIAIKAAHDVMEKIHTTMKDGISASRELIALELRCLIRQSLSMLRGGSLKLSR